MCKLGMSWPYTKEGRDCVGGAESRSADKGEYLRLRLRALKRDHIRVLETKVRTGIYSGLNSNLRPSIGIKCSNHSTSQSLLGFHTGPHHQSNLIFSYLGCSCCFLRFVTVL